MSTPPTPPNPNLGPPLRPRPATVPKAKALNCPKCGSAIEIRTFGNAVNIICQSCHSVLDSSDEKLKIIEEANKRIVIDPLIPLGSRGKWKGRTYEVVGFQRRTINVDGVDYHWFEYLLYNPFAGYRYLTEYNGHWNDVTVCHTLPTPAGLDGEKPQVRIGDQTFTHFQTATACTTFILGEFPWQVRMGDKADAMDYISSPFILSSESIEDEVTWSTGEYVDGSDIRDAFKVKDSFPSPMGVYCDQPNPYGDEPGHFWKRGWLFIVLAMFLVIAAWIMALKANVYSEGHMFKQGGQAEASFVTPEFNLGGHISNVVIDTDTNLVNDWMYIHYSLINTETNVAYDFGREISYYYGTDSDGSWTEGSNKDSATVPSIPPGKYYLRVEPEMDAKSSAVYYHINVHRDMPTRWYFFVAAVLLLIPPIFVSIRTAAFEVERWAESDYGGSSSDDSEDSDTDETTKGSSSPSGGSAAAGVAAGAAVIAAEIVIDAILD